MTFLKDLKDVNTVSASEECNIFTVGIFKIKGLTKGLSFKHMYARDAMIDQTALWTLAILLL